MVAVAAERQRLDPAHGVSREGTVKMREERTTARRLPFEQVPEHRRINGDEHEIALTCAVLRRRCGKLCGRRKMNEPVGRVLRGAAIDASSFRRAPFVAAAHVVNELGHGKTLAQRVQSDKGKVPCLV